jgi:ABC-type bacteriocin/lantibiotic exporter with double-glycine peptidase domain
MTVDHSVQYQQQTQAMSCWAASTAMMLGWKNNQSYPESAVLEQFRSFGVDGADDAECEQLARTLGMTILTNQCAMPEEWERQLSSGPIMVGSPTHVIVVAGITGDGTPDGSQFHVLDPARGDSWRGFMEVESAYELNPSAGYNNNLFQW